MTTGEKIREARLRAGFTQKRLSELTGIAEPTLRKYESNRLNPKKETLEKIASPLGIHYLSLYDDDLADLAPFFKENALPSTEPSMFETEQKAAALGMTVVEYLLSKPETREVGEQYQILLKQAEKHDSKARIDAAFELLNNDGQKKAAERVEELTEIPKYQRKAPPEGKDTPPGGTPTEVPPEDR